MGISGGGGGGLRNLYFFNIQISGVTTADSRRKVMGIAGGGGRGGGLRKVLDGD